MCGRFTLTTTPSELAAVFDLDPAALGRCELAPRYNIAPTQSVVLVRREAPGRALARAQWGLIPSWASDEKIGTRLINARCETAHERPAFRDAMRHRRCLIPASGFYEWGRHGAQRGPYWFAPTAGGLFAFAGLWESWRGADETVETCTILTTEANALVAPVHERMPVILPREAQGAWLDPLLTDPSALASWLQPVDDSLLVARRVSRRVNEVGFDDAACIEPEVEAGPDWGPLFGGS